MNSLILAVFLAATAPQPQEGATTQEDVTPVPATVTVSTKIKGAYAYVDRVTVIKVNEPFEVPPGKHEIVVMAKGYYDLHLDTDLKAGEKKKLNIRMMLPGVSTLDAMESDPGKMVFACRSGDWLPTDPDPSHVENQQFIVKGSPLPGRGVSIIFRPKYKSPEYIIRFDYYIESGKMGINVLGVNAPATNGRWHSVIICIGRTSYCYIDWRKIAMSPKDLQAIKISYKRGSSGQVVFRNFSYVDATAKTEEGQK